MRALAAVLAFVVVASGEVNAQTILGVVPDTMNYQGSQAAQKDTRIKLTIPGGSGSYIVSFSANINLSESRVTDPHIAADVRIYDVRTDDLVASGQVFLHNGRSPGMRMTLPLSFEGTYTARAQDSDLAMEVVVRPGTVLSILNNTSQRSGQFSPAVFKATKVR